MHLSAGDSLYGARARLEEAIAMIPQAQAQIITLANELDQLFRQRHTLADVESVLRTAFQQREQAIRQEYEEVLVEHRRLVRKLDFFMNGKQAALQASLCDLVGSFHQWNIKRERAVWELAAKEIERRRDHWDWGIKGVTGYAAWCRQQAEEVGLSP